MFVVGDGVRKLKADGQNRNDDSVRPEWEEFLATKKQCPAHNITMPPLPSTTLSPPIPRLIIYYQTHHAPSGLPISLLPLVATPTISLTHLILAAIHLNAPPQGSPTTTPCTLTLNDHVPAHPRNVTLWAELSVLQASGIKVLGMLGGAAKGTFTLLDVPFPDDGFPLDEHDETFEAHYAVLADFIREKRLDGLDLDVEEPMSLPGILRLIDRLHKDFDSPEKDFIITLAPVAAALLVDDPKANLSGFDYEALEVLRGEKIDWYNTQFYCGWGDMHSSVMYDAIVAKGWPSNKVVVGLVTSSENGSGFVNMTILSWVLAGLRRRYGSAFAGVMGWEYFNSEPGGKASPWTWAEWMSGILGRVVPRGGENRVSSAGVQGSVAGEVMDSQKGHVVAAVVEERVQFSVVDGDIGEEASLPETFEYFTDESVDS